MTPLRIAIIGAGRASDVHARAISSLADAEIVAVADPREDAAQRLATSLGVPAYTSLDQALDSTPINAVDIVAPPHLHHDLGMRALRAGVHVFMDKPIATSFEDGLDLCELADDRGLVLMICHNLLFHPGLQRVVGLVADGVLGRPTHADAWSMGWLDIAPWDFRLDADATGGGAWVDGAPHLVYALEACLGPMKLLRAATASGPSRLGGEDTAVGHAVFESGGVATLAVAYADCPQDPEASWPEGWRLGMRLVGTDGRIDVDFLPFPRVLWRRIGQPQMTEDLGAVPFEAGFAGALAEFVAGVLGTARTSVSARDSLRNLGLIRDALSVR